MILLKIGSAPNSDIVLNSPYVSAQHAEMLIGDDGTVMIEDKNSSNGTFVNKQRITPNSRQTVRRGDLITFGNQALQWHQVPVLPDTSKYKQVISIGTDYNNDINVTNQFASRYHATLYIDKDGKAYITDYNSKNGTEVNGTKIPRKKPFRIKRGDNVTIGTADITDQITPYIPNPFGWVKKLAIGIAAIIVLGVIGTLAAKLINAPSAVELEKVQTSVVMVYGQYSVYVELEDNPIHEEIWNRVMELTGKNYQYGRLPIQVGLPYTGTAFFLDQEGRMATNRHVAIPWEYAEESQKKEFRSAAEQYIHDQLPAQISSAEIAAFYDESNSLLWPMVKLQTRLEGNNLTSYANSLIRQLNNTKRNVVGAIDYFGVAYPGRHYDSVDEFDRCTMLDYSKDADIDLALIQLNNPHTPASVEWVFDPELFNLEKLTPQGSKLTWIGYPNGLSWARDVKTHQMRPQVRETMCSSAPSKYDFDLQGEIVPGASGSPVFESNTGRLVGVAYAHLVGASTFGRAVQAKYLKEMYDKEVK